VFWLSILLPHNPAHLVAADLMAIVAQVFNHSTGTATAPVLIKYFFNSAVNALPTGYHLRCISGQIIVKSAPAHPHDRTQHGYGIGLHLLPDKIESQFDSLAKKAAAFFKISRSIKRRLFSFLRPGLWFHTRRKDSLLRRIKMIHSRKESFLLVTVPVYMILPVKSMSFGPV
jgi:hypothetical protein